jgi:hypothetical protein
LPALRLGTDWRISEEAASSYEALHSTAAPTERTDATPDVAMRQEMSHAVPAGFDLPAEYAPRFPSLWGLTQEEAASRAAGGSRSATKRKRPSAATKRR